uniref:endogenous retrovirus group K member 24 Gag polyprotein-like isoform X2 n=1 Tax=Ictidomys tridecemlineatus TaxID=43179 RepID=UPI001A9FCDAB|nr:endogenous retrovirus group K member 24 Gag polyprotein-like isoform X2 [Ictidomys tridecemlineatus]
MGNSTSTGKDMYLAILEMIINQKEKQIKKTQLLQFLKVVGEFCPWFCDQDSPNLHTWDKLGRKLHKICLSNELPGNFDNIQRLWTALEICLFDYMGHSPWPTECLLKGIQRAIKSIQMENLSEAKVISFPLSPIKTKAPGAKPKVRNVSVPEVSQGNLEEDPRDEDHRQQASGGIDSSLPGGIESPPGGIESNPPGEENPEEIPREVKSPSPPRGLEAQFQNGDSENSAEESQSEGEESDIEIQDLQGNFNRLRLTPPAQAIRIRPLSAKRMVSLRSKSAEARESKSLPEFYKKKGGMCGNPFSH